MSNQLSRRQFLVGAAALTFGTAAFGLPRRAFADDAAAEDGAIVILHTNDIHCAVGETDASGTVPLGFSALASYAADRKKKFGSNNVTLVDAGDAVQGKVMGTLTQGQAIVDIMNETGYDLAIPGNHEFDYGMTQFNHLVGSAKATYLSCNFTDKRPDEPTLMFSPYDLREYALPNGDTTRVAFVGVTTPATLTSSSPKSFWRSEDDHTFAYGFCEDDTGDALVAAVQQAVDKARAAGADYVVLLAHLGQDDSLSIWRSDTLAKRCRGIDVIIDGHSHQEYVQVKQDADGKDVIITQTGTQFSSVGQVVINPKTSEISASTPAFEATLLRETRKSDDPAYVHEATFGRDSTVQEAVSAQVAEVKKQTGTVVGTSEVDLFAYEDDNYTWAVRTHETNLSDFVADAYLYYATNAGITADLALINGAGLRANLHKGNVTKGDLINVNPYNNQLCYTSVLGQDLLDAFEISASKLPDTNGNFLQVSEGVSLTIRTDIDSPVIYEGANVTGIDDAKERRVRRVTLHGKALDPQATYTLVCHSYYLIDGGGSYTMLNKNPATLLALDNEALMEYLQVNLHCTIGQAYANASGAGRIIMQAGPDPQPDSQPDADPDPQPSSQPDSQPDANPGQQQPGSQPDPQPKQSQSQTSSTANSKPIAATGDTASVAAAAAVAAATASAALLATSLESEEN